jgi:hypothetical protein
MANIKKSKLAELSPDTINPNQGSVRGTAMLERSLEDYGAGRSILVDKNGKVIAGNKTLESAVSIGLEDALVVHTTGKELVVVQRDDLDLDTDSAAKELGVSDNRVGEVNLSWSVEMLKKLEDEGAKLDKFFTASETDELLQQALAYNPELNPSIATGEVTDKDIAKAEGAIEGQFVNDPSGGLIETRCPECNHQFHVSPVSKAYQK